MRAIERTLRLLELLSEQPESMGVVQLGEQLHLPPSTLHRLLSVLVAHGYVVQDPGSRRYRLGSSVLRIAQSYLRQNTVLAAAQPLLARLRSATQETIFLTALVGDDAVCVATAESPRPLQFYMRVGQRMPYHAAASARAILAFRGAGEARRLLRGEALDRFTNATPRSVEDVLEELSLVRRQGYAVCEEEMEVGVTAVSAPVRDAAGEVVASVTVVAPSERLDGARLQAALAPLLVTSAQISHTLGYQDPQPETHHGERPYREASRTARLARA